MTALEKAKEIFMSWRVLLLIAVIILSIIAISPQFETKGVVITSVATNSSAEINGLTANTILYDLNGEQINSVHDYSAAVDNIKAKDIVKFGTSSGGFSFIAESNILGEIDLGITIDKVPESNLKLGLDLVGGVRVLLQPDEELTNQEFQDIVDITQRRLNVYGLSDIHVRQVSDLEGESFILVELAGTSNKDIVKTLVQQGKFEAKIANETVFVGGVDVKSVCRSADCSGVRSCSQISDGTYACNFEFRVDISPEAAKRHADITKDLTTQFIGGSQYLSERLDLYLDGELVDSLLISVGLKGQETTSFTIQGPGNGPTEEVALNNALDNMRELQTVLITGSLPVKLNIVKTDFVSGTLGEDFFNTTITAIIIAILAVGAIVFVRYRKLKIALPILITGLSEVLIILGFAALVKWNLDLAALAGILAAVGTGVDSQIVITDEVLHGIKTLSTWKERVSRAFFIIFGSYSTVVAAMLPLWFMGAGLLKGFAIVTILGVSIGVFITRPAYAKIIEVLLK
ncbi:MAG: protein translocase subunit SecD [DPANN group archaeon]|nr:protein translocase subunit SecD [DPANN group archaeon]